MVQSFGKGIDIKEAARVITLSFKKFIKCVPRLPFSVDQEVYGEPETGNAKPLSLHIEISLESTYPAFFILTDRI
jgi:hypothetical protein